MVCAGEHASSLGGPLGFVCQVAQQALQLAQVLEIEGLQVYEIAPPRLPSHLGTEPIDEVALLVLGGHL